ncbi:hypothetical protein F4780DRAFT_469992 [Xylariomycetidae sp. FL0641]|nr:hypothetical protein F4780DRAFT_469992 [Xylariomycetidae sp. FL0641]
MTTTEYVPSDYQLQLLASYFPHVKPKRLRAQQQSLAHPTRCKILTRRLNAQPQQLHGTPYAFPTRARPRLRPQWLDDSPAQLARDADVRLPGDRAPPLQREEAFRGPRGWACDDAELVRLGLLYDDDDDAPGLWADGQRAEGFALGDVVHGDDEPVYAVRPARRRRGRGRERGGDGLAGSRLDIEIDWEFLDAGDGGGGGGDAADEDSAWEFLDLGP